MNPLIYGLRDIAHKYIKKKILYNLKIKWYEFMNTHIQIFSNTNFKKCSCCGLNENCFMCNGKGWIDEENDLKTFNISSKFENNEDICWEIEIYIQRKEYNLARKLLNENKNKIMKNSYDQLIHKCNETDT